MRICVFGAASTEIDKSYITAVENLGKQIAERGHSLVFGAGASGLMGAAARGVHAGSGEIIGVIPTFFKDEEIEAIYEECDQLILTEDMAERKATMEDLADAFVIVPGGVGTFEEFFQVFTAKQLVRHNKPIAIFDVNDYYKELDDFLRVAVKEKFIRKECAALYDYTSNLDELFAYLENDKRIIHNVHDLKNG
ncbi:MAG: TIGR00730 family Rossman fold protein [Clostridia bacterium]|nr:TIGR00730 family Rossman fold protein [Clostridia bacterium]